jgi:NADH:ubiquinone oxidoreductase subunit 6 (subunit J)
MDAITVFGVLALTFMMAMYSIEQRHRGYTLAFAFGCLLSSGYGFLIGAWPFGVVEIIWCAVALRKFSTAPGSTTKPTEP